MDFYTVLPEVMCRSLQFTEKFARAIFNVIYNRNPVIFYPLAGLLFFLLGLLCYYFLLYEYCFDTASLIHIKPLILEGFYSYILNITVMQYSKLVFTALFYLVLQTIIKLSYTLQHRFSNFFLRTTHFLRTTKLITFLR